MTDRCCAADTKPHTPNGLVLHDSVWSVASVARSPRVPPLWSRPESCESVICCDTVAGGPR